MIKRVLLLVVAVVALFSCSKKEPQFQLTGHIDGLDKGEMIYLYSKAERMDVDSVINVDGGFLFTGSITEPTYHYIIVRRDNESSRYKGFWLENTSVSINGDIADLSSAKVEGSEVQKQEDEFFTQIKVLSDQLDDLYAKYNPKNKDEAEIISTKIDSIMALEDQEKVKFIKNNPDYLYAAILAKRVVRSISAEEGQIIYDVLSEELKQTQYGVAVKDFLDLNKDLKVGDDYVELSLPDANGVEKPLSSLNGKYVLIDFWASWCGPCRRESPYLTKAYEQFADKGFEIYGVSIDHDKEKWQEAITEDNMIWTSVIADGAFDSKSAMIYGVKYIPFNYLIDPDGKIIAMHLRGEALLEKLEELL